LCYGHQYRFFSISYLTINRKNYRAIRI